YPFKEGVAGFAGVSWTREFGSDDEVDEDGVIRKIGVTPPPYQRPHPEVWVPFTVSPATLVAAAREGFSCLAVEGRPARPRVRAGGTLRRHPLHLSRRDPGGGLRHGGEDRRLRMAPLLQQVRLRRDVAHGRRRPEPAG